MMEGEKMESHQKENLKLKCFSPLKILTLPFIWRDYWSFPFSFFFSISRGLGGFDYIWGENHFFKNFFSYGFNILVVDTYSGMELCTPTWLNHDYGDKGVVDILVVDAYFRMELCTLTWLKYNYGDGGCGYIGGGRIFQSGVMHANIFGWG
jgi:hypothetical protein